MSTNNLLQNFKEYYYICAFQVAFFILLVITSFPALLFLFYEIFVCTISLRSHDIARNKITNDPERGTESLNAGEIMERSVVSESQTLLRIHEALGALRPRNQQQQQPGNDKRKEVIRSLPKPESYGGRYQRIRNNTEEERVICLEEFVSGDVCRVLPMCKHIFHLGCIDKWLLSHQLTCPICRSSAINV